MAGLRFGTPEVVRWGMTQDDMATVAELVARALSGDPRDVAAETTALRRRFDTVGFARRD
jgi:glycine hydroxymethyltransferase